MFTSVMSFATSRRVCFCRTCRKLLRSWFCSAYSVPQEVLSSLRYKPLQIDGHRPRDSLNVSISKWNLRIPVVAIWIEHDQILRSWSTVGMAIHGSQM